MVLVVVAAESSRLSSGSSWKPIAAVFSVRRALRHTKQQEEEKQAWDEVGVDTNTAEI